MSHQREVYLLAANYLQTRDWRGQPELLGQLVAFYGKAGAYESLAAFYVGCAQLEVAESHNYAQALQVRRRCGVACMLGVHAGHARLCVLIGGGARACMPPLRMHACTQALQEAAKHLGRSRAADAQAQQAALAARGARMSRFLDAQRQLAADPAAAVLNCQQLLQEARDGEVRRSWQARRQAGRHCTGRRV